jgi:transcriptional regulator of acetoin/glycerol metabolism
LYFRISQPEIHLPPLRERIEEIPWHVQSALETCGLPCPIEATSPFVEACALRHWPGNVRELRAEVRRAAADACAREATTLGADALSPGAGQRITESDSSATAAPIPEDEVAQALAVEAGNVVGAARRLGIHRNKIRRWLSRHRLEARRFRE